MSSAISDLSDVLGLSEDNLTFEEYLTSPDYMGLSSIYEFWLDELGSRKVPDSVNELILNRVS